MPTPGKIRIGTSGWRYEHWIGPVYPDGLAECDMLPYYAGALGCVEINSSFYGLPSADTARIWHDVTPPGFVFAVKASRYITHMKKLKDPAEPVARLFEAIEPLGAKLGPILFQLPPRWRANAARLERFLSVLPAHHRYAFEFRDESWFTDEIAQVLTGCGAAFCIYELGGRQSPERMTADFGYVRLHGPDEAYRGRYGEAALKRWSDRLALWRKAGLDIYCFFDNDEGGYAFANAVRLRTLTDAT